MWFFKPKGFFPPDQRQDIEDAMEICDDAIAQISLPLFQSEHDRQLGLAAYKAFVEVALGESLPDDLAERTTYLEKIVRDMRNVRLTLTDRSVLSSIGNLLIDSGIRKGRGIDQRIPQDEVMALKKTLLRYLRYTNGKL